ncbi:MAG TPA: peptidoglycan-binding domain-containing protein [Acidimicrobiia bacterium]|nr:peptidoglycan-binding domain-containing protein [Acidimicrobiia bacterium]
MPRRIRSIPALLVAALVAASCGGGTGSTTTTTGSTLATTTSSSTTTTTEPPVVNGPPIAEEGDRNETVVALQFLMNCAGYGPLDVDGAFGPATASAVEAMQEDLGREVTGAPDDFTLALLSRACSETRRLTLDDGQAVAVGNVSSSDPDTYFLEAEDGDRLAVVLDSSTGGARVDVRAADGGAIGPASISAWGLDLSESQDHVIIVSAVGDATTYVLTAKTLEPPEDGVTPADPDTVAVDELEEAVIDVCLDTTGDRAYVAETGSGYLVVAEGAPGSYAAGHGGIGAAVEFINRDGSPGYYGFLMDLEVAIDDRVTGTAAVYLDDPDATEPVDLAFDFTRSAAVCEGGAAIPIVLGSDGLEVVDFGSEADAAIALVRQSLPDASPAIDTGWVPIDPAANEYGVCRADVSEVRVVTIDNLVLYFSDRATQWHAQGVRHFVGYRVAAGVFPLATDQGVGPGSTIADVLTGHPDAGIGVGLEGGSDVFVTSPPGADTWLRALAPGASGPTDTDAEITAIVGGRFCDL